MTKQSEAKKSKYLKNLKIIMKKLPIKIIVLTIVLFIQDTNLLAAHIIGTRASKNNLRIMAGLCGDYMLDPECEDLGTTTFNSDKAYIIKENGKAYMVNGLTKIQLGSDNLEVFLLQLRSKYGITKKYDKKVEEQINKEYALFLKTDDGIIGSTRLNLISAQLGLKIRNLKNNN